MTVSLIKRLFKAMGLLGLLVQGYVLACWRMDPQDPARTCVHIKTWATRVCELLGADIQVRGDMAPAGGLLVVSNHISWLDILVYLSIRPMRFVAKSEVARWPIVGRLAQACGTVFVTRNSKRDALRVVHAMVDALNHGDVVAIFPEGTTSPGFEVLPFHANLMQAGVVANVPVQACAIQYLSIDAKNIVTQTSYVEQDSLVASIWRILGMDGFCVRVHWASPQPCGSRDRRELALDLFQEVVCLKAQSHHASSAFGTGVGSSA